MPDYVLAPGFARNPLRRHRNLPCPCGSGRKIKRCHGLIDVIPVQDAEKCKDYLRLLAQHGFIRIRPIEVA